LHFQKWVSEKIELKNGTKETVIGLIITKDETPSKKNPKPIVAESSDDDEAPEMVQSSKAKLAFAQQAEREVKQQSAKDKKLKRQTKKAEKRKVEDDEEEEEETNNQTKKHKKLLDTSVLDFLVQEEESKKEQVEEPTSEPIQATIETAKPNKSRSKRFIDLGLEAKVAKGAIDPFTVTTQVDPNVLKWLHLEFYKKNFRKGTLGFVEAKKSTVEPASDFFGKDKWLIDRVFLQPFDLQK